MKILKGRDVQKTGEGDEKVFVYVSQAFPHTSHHSEWTPLNL